MKILKYSEYVTPVEMAEFFLNSIGDKVNESDEKSYKDTVDKIILNLNLNSSLILKIITGLNSICPVVSKLVSNMNLNIVLNPESISLMTMCSLVILHLETKKEGKEKIILEKDAKSMLEELKLMGIGNGVIKKIVTCIKSIGNIFKILFKGKMKINNFFDVINKKIMSPTINSISNMISKYHLDLDTLPANFLSLGLGVTTLTAKNGIDYITNILRSKLNISKDDILGNINDIDDPILKSQPQYVDDKIKLIKDNDN